ncbi:MAG: DHA2 family efflux MFS transporter permease subunit [Spongiibacteraceae bacterium]
MSESIPSNKKLQNNTVREDKPPLETKHRGLLLLAIIGVSIIQVMDMTIANVALPHMRAGLGASSESITWILTSFIIAGVMVMPIVGWVSDRFGSRPVFIWAVAGFLLASMLCGAATSLVQMVIFRGLQGISAAFIGSMTQTILFDITTTREQPRVMSLWGMVIMIAPIMGPLVGGILTDAFSWRWVFYINLPIGIPTLVILIWLLPSRPIVPRKLDQFGFCILAVGLVSLQLLLDRGQHKDWLESWEIIIELLIVLAALWVFFVHTVATKRPLFPRELIKNVAFVSTLSFMFVLGVANVSIASILPTMYQTVFGYSAFDTGVLMMPRGFGVLLAMFVAGRLVTKVDIRYLIVVGYIITSVAMYQMSRWTLQMDSWLIITSGFIQGLGMGLVFMPMNLAAFSTLAVEHRPDGSSLLNLMRNLGGSFGISAIITMLARNSQVSHSDLTANITIDSLSNSDIVAVAESMGPSYATGILQMLDIEINRQALFIAYLDNFYALAFIVFGIALLPLLLKPIRI